MNGPSSGRLGSAGSPQQAIFWGGSDSSAADRSFTFDDFPLDALLGRSAAESEALPKPLVPMEVSSCKNCDMFVVVGPNHHTCCLGSTVDLLRLLIAFLSDALLGHEVVTANSHWCLCQQKVLFLAEGGL